MLYMVGVILQRAKMPSASSIQVWFERHQYPLSIDGIDDKSTSFVVSGSALGQRCYADFRFEAIEKGRQSFSLVYDEFFDEGDCVCSSVATASLTQRAFVFLIISAIAELSGGLLIEDEQPDPSNTADFKRLSIEFLTRARLLLVMHYRQGQSKSLHLDTQAVPLMDGESESDRNIAISQLKCDKYITPLSDQISVDKRKAYHLSNSGLELARSMYLFDISEKSREHRHLIIAKES